MSIRLVCKHWQKRRSYESSIHRKNENYQLKGLKLFDQLLSLQLEAEETLKYR